MALFNLSNTSISKKSFNYSAIFISILVFIIYGSSLKNDFAMDDEYVSLKNAQVQKGISAIPEILSSTYVNDEKQKYEYRPLVKVTYALEYSLFGGKVSVSHFINLLLYILLCVILYYLLLKLFPNYHYLFSLLAIILFVIHPLHSEVVLSLKNRDGILSFMFASLALLTSLSYVDRKKNYLLIIASLLLFLAMLSKKDALTFYATIPFVLWYFRDIKLKRIVLVYCFLVALYFVFFALESHINNQPSRTLLFWENPLFVDTNIFERIPEGIYSFWFYLKMFVLPHPLIAYYGYDQFSVIGYSDVIFWILLFVTGIGTYFLFKGIKEKTVWAFGITFFIISISMFTNIVQPVVGIVGERFAFIASFGLCISAAWLLFKVFKINMSPTSKSNHVFKSNFIITILIITIVYGGKSFSRNSAWKDSLTLYRTDVLTATESAHTHSLYAAACVAEIRKNRQLPAFKKKEFAELAVKHFKESLRIYPEYLTSLSNIGMVYHSLLSQPQLALPYLEKAVLLDSTYVEAYYNLATCNASLKNYDIAEKQYLKVLSLKPDFLPLYESLSNLYALQKKSDRILEINQIAIKNGLNSDVPYINIGNVYFMRGDTLAALPYLEKAVSITPNNRGVNSFLFNYYSKKGDSSKAEVYRRLLMNTPR